ncbi:MAG: hypothetical protein LBE95_02335 [Holosporaceae bacterium]|nr:hypothetical protein [Holosporaceae bacterium]
MKRVIFAIFVMGASYAVGADIDEEESVEQKVDGDAFAGTFLGISLAGSLKTEMLEYREINHSISCPTPISSANANAIAAQANNSIHMALSSITNDSASPHITDINYNAAREITGYSAYGQLSGNINRSTYLAPVAGVTLLHNWKVYDNKIIGIDFRCEFSPPHRKKNPKDPLFDVHRTTSLGSTERRSDCVAMAMSVRIGTILCGGLHYIALGIKRTGFCVKTMHNIDLKTKLFSPTFTVGTAKSIGDSIYLIEATHSFKVGKKHHTTYDQILFAYDEKGRKYCPAHTSLGTRASSQETCLSFTFARKISSLL